MKVAYYTVELHEWWYVTAVIYRMIDVSRNLRPRDGLPET